MGRYFAQIDLLPFLWIWVTYATFQQLGNRPSVSDLLNNRVSALEIAGEAILIPYQGWGKSPDSTGPRDQ